MNNLFFIARSMGLVAVMLLAGSTFANASDVHKIDQLQDFTATTPERFYRFEPNYLWVKPGDTVRFMNSLGNHTVKTVDGMWPKGVAKVDIAHRQQYDIVLKEPGVYGMKCKIHNRHGMFALVIVGDVKPDFEQWKKARLNGVGRKIFKRLFARLEQDLEKRNNENR